MPRRPRLDFPGAVHHVWSRGVVRRPIVVDDADRLALRGAIERAFVAGGARALAWVFMTNHVHMLVRSGEACLSDVMHSVLSTYAHEFNHRHDGSGHVFQDRFENRPIDDGTDLRGVVRYVLRNPIEAGMMDLEALETYRWSAYPTLLGTRAPFAFEDRDFVDDLIGDADSLRGWIGDGGVSDRRSSLYARLVEEVCRACEVTPAEILSGSRRFPVTRARTEIIRRSFHDLGFSNVEIARRLRITRSAVTHALGRR